MTRIRFEDLPSTNTPRNAENLNKLNNVVISSTEPTTGEEVWIQKGKNLFDINALAYDSKVENLSNDNTISVKVLDSSYDFFGANFTLTNLSKNTDYVLKANVLDVKFDKAYIYSDELYGTSIANGTIESGLIFNTGNNTKVVVGLYIENPVVGTVYSIDKIQVEQGSTATEYEPYINKKIHTKNDNGVYEEFNNVIVASGSNENGSYAKYADGTMIQHGTGQFGNSGTSTDSYALTTFPQTFINGNWSIQYTPLYTNEFSQNFTLATILTGSHIYGEPSNGNKADYVYRRLSYLSPDAVGQADLYACSIPYSWVAIGYWK